MPEVIDPPKKSFSQLMADSRPSNEAELKAMQAGAPPPEPPKPKPADSPPAPPPGKPAPPVAPPADDQEARDQRLSAENKDFKRVKHAATEANKRADEIKVQHEIVIKELAELKKNSGNRGDAEKIAKLEKDRDEFKAKFEQVAVEIDPQKIKEHQSRLNAVRESVKSLAADKADEILRIFAMPEGDRKRKALSEAVEDMDPITVDDINAARRDYNAVLASRQAEIEKANDTLSTMANERQKQKEERKTAYAKSFDAALAAMSNGDGAIPVLQTREGETPEVKAWNDGVTERRVVARAYFMDEFETPEEKADAAIWAASAPGFLAELKAAQTENAALKETLAKVQGSSPSLMPGGKPPDGGKKMSFSERVMENAM